MTEPIEPGDLIEIDPNDPGRYRKERLLAESLQEGIGTLRAGVAELSRWEERSQRLARVGLPVPGRPLLALMGRVYVKATTENGPIRPGDLLVSASTGYVMRCSDPWACEGAVVGKALEPLKSGQGRILMLVMR